ncbi:general transcription factor IIE subunit 2 isoform X2 [Anopheles ziemanni]|uniref:general transcription factor IIE subunit 2 isoform X2 n=1 Tax=Anopheles ziemanni TaxID=345580 RepID=UPI00265EB3A1|nr:general transcription factor IIE subunit 2 isoform X2 [Anopheles ziemanni]
MDPALLREREAFKRRAMATPTVEKKAKTESSFAPPKDVKKSRPVSAAPKIDASNYKTMTGSSQYRFGVLAKIVKHMRTRHQEGDDHPLTLDEILDETNQLDIGSSVKAWLQAEALRNNPKIEHTPDGRYLFKSVFKIKDGKSLMRLLKQHDLKGLGGVLLDDVQESLPHCDKVDEDFQKLWRSVTVDAMDDAKIDEYLEKQGIRSMQDHGPKKPLLPKRKKLANKKRQFKKPRDNEHLADVLETYEDNTLTQSNAVQEIKQNN